MTYMAVSFGNMSCNMFRWLQVLVVTLYMGSLVCGSQQQNLDVNNLSKQHDQFNKDNKELFYFDMDHDFEPFNNLQSRSSISMLTNDTFQQKRDRTQLNQASGQSQTSSSPVSGQSQTGSSSASTDHPGGSSNPNVGPPGDSKESSTNSNSQQFSNSPGTSNTPQQSKSDQSSSSASTNGNTNSGQSAVQDSTSQQSSSTNSSPNTGTSSSSSNDQSSSSSSSSNNGGSNSPSSSDSNTGSESSSSTNTNTNSNNHQASSFSNTDNSDSSSSSSSSSTDNTASTGTSNGPSSSTTDTSSTNNLGATDDSGTGNVAEAPADVTNESPNTDDDNDEEDLSEDSDLESDELLNGSDEYTDEDEIEGGGDDESGGDDDSDANMEYYNNGVSDEGDASEIKDLNEDSEDPSKGTDDGDDSDTNSAADTRVLNDNNNVAMPSSSAMSNTSSSSDAAASESSSAEGQTTSVGGSSSEGQTTSTFASDSQGSLDNDDNEDLSATDDDTEEGALDDEDEENEDESFDSDSDDDEDPEETGDEDFDSSEDGKENDLESAENDDEEEEEEDEDAASEDSEEEGDSDDKNYDYQDVDVLNEDEDDDDAEDGSGVDEEEQEEMMGGDDAEGLLDTRQHDLNSSPEDTSNTQANQQMATQDQASSEQGLFGGLKRHSKKLRRRRGRRRGRKFRLRLGRVKKIRLRKMKKLKLRKLKFIRLRGRFRGGRRRKNHRHGRKKMGSKFIRLGGKMIRVGGGIRAGRVKMRRIKMKVKISFKVSLMRFWDWRRFIRGFKYESIGKANVGVLIDGGIKKHLGMVQRWVYNLVLLFQRGSYISFGSYGGSVNLATDFKTFGSAGELKSVLSGLKAQAGGRKIGEALEFYYPLFKAAAGKSKLKSMLFLFATGMNKGSARKMKEYGLKYKRLGVVIFVFGLGTRTSVSEFRSITTSTRVFSAGNYKSVILGGMGLRLGYKPGMRRSIFVILQSRLSRWLGMKVGLSSKHATHHHGHSHKEWWFSMWNWYKYIGLRYGSIGRANIAFVIDGTNAELVMFLQRFVYNLGRLFQSQGTSISILAYGKRQHLVTKWQTFTSAQEFQAQASAIPFIQSKRRNTAGALLRMFKMYRAFLLRPNAAKIPNLLFVMSTGPSTDTGKFIAVKKLYMKAGINIFTFGIGPEGKRASLQLKALASNSRFSFAGDVSGLIQKASFTMFSGGLLKLVGAGNAIQFTTGTKIMRKVQFKWNWRVGMRSIRYGYLARANIGILIDGVDVQNFGYLRRFVYNIIRMYSLSGTYVSLMIYGTKVYRVANFVQLRSPAQIRRLVSKIPKVANGKRRTGAALQAMLTAFGDAPPGNPNVLYAIIHGPSSDSVNAPGALLRKYGIKTFPIGIGAGPSPKELATISFSSSTIFKSGPNGLVHTLNNMQSAAATISGTVSKACGKAGHTRCGKKNIVKQWQWKTYGIKFSYGVVAKASIVFLIDGTNRNHFDVMQKLTYNIYKLFGQGTSAAIITYGGAANKKLGKFRLFADGTAFQAFVSAVDYRGPPGRNTGAALASALTAFKGATGGKKICFLLTTGKSTDDVSAPAKAMVKSGVSIFALGIGKFASQKEMKQISRYYLVTKWKGLLTSMVKVANSLKKVVGGAADVIPDVGPQPEPPQGDPPKKPPLPVPTAGFIASSSTQPIGLLQTKWDWLKMMNLQTGVLGASNVIFVLDVSKDDNIDIIQRFMAQLLLLFKYQECTFTLVLASDTPVVSFNKKTFKSNQEIIETMKLIKAKASAKLKTGKALTLVKKTLLPTIENDAKTPVLFLITRTKSSDDISKVAEQIRGSGIKTVGIGIGNDYSQEELGMISINGQLGLSGAITTLPALLGRIIFGLNVIINGPPDAPTMTLSGMAGKMPTLAGAVMNTVQTGSVPSETAGQTGNPNTGSTAGDAQGDDTGGTAGSPEEGGATKPDGTTEKLPPQPPAPGPKETSGGATGAGGSDVVAGGGVAGATEAIAGQSKQDGGTGGPADGKVTTGNSNKPVTPDGEPATLPVKPDGTPVEPTNPDGSPGTGTPNPDGTPADPDASSPPGTNSDGTPAEAVSDPEKKPAAVPPVTPVNPAAAAGTDTPKPAAMGGCACPGNCPEGCVPVMCTSPSQKDCIGRSNILKKFTKELKKDGESSEDDIDSIKTLLKDYFKDTKKKAAIPAYLKGRKIESEMKNM